MDVVAAGSFAAGQIRAFGIGTGQDFALGVEDEKGPVGRKARDIGTQAFLGPGRGAGEGFQDGVLAGQGIGHLDAITDGVLGRLGDQPGGLVQGTFLNAGHHTVRRSGNVRDQGRDTDQDGESGGNGEPGVDAGMSLILFKVVDLMVGIRVSVDDETKGLDVSQHSEVGYQL